VNAGILLQVDDPHLVTYWIKEPDLTLEQFRKWAQLRVEALNHALRNIQPEKVRHHTCYGINMGPRIHDLEFKHIVDIVLKMSAGAYCGFATFAGSKEVHPSIVWAKFTSLVEGARLASQQLWGGR
jgi:5-methyltetrahydropteroyltriglutamate--homocysteine methyltransferase